MAMFEEYLKILQEENPCCYALVRGDEGNEKFEKVKGRVLFFSIGEGMPTGKGMLVVADINGFPIESGDCGGRFYGFHIHDGGECSGNSEDAFADAGTHLNPLGCPHPYHMGDMPVLSESGGRAFSIFYTERFTSEDIAGRTVIIHDMPDDYRSQPAGGSGTKVACGQIKCMLALGGQI